MVFKKILSLLIAAGLTMGGALAADHHHEHDHHAGTSAQLMLQESGAKWSTDVPLRSGMEQIRKRMGDSLEDIHAGKLASPQYAKLAREVRGDINTIIANCKLDPKADEQLHLILGRMLAGVERMGGKSKAGRHQGAVGILKALDDYSAYFDHPGWGRIQH
ncbi:hypothetical protein [Denitratisoma oestradiolicum]|uniref:DnrO protein n=1 Tax=Denitratisoma oestradiolicum TaxID=311182 RepID=A0A6S6XY31_9PROT|nr:hypothetical protein [Denitratisoma oestradiolicum]TWO78759.1 hypothetical protein CBW56_18380 [Denitratisoma oestradiolicum]CAB1369257.1 conserved exported protein of unknown function [Denitratisoma oestradiolicum]